MKKHRGGETVHICRRSKNQSIFDFFVRTGVLVSEAMDTFATCGRRVTSGNCDVEIAILKALKPLAKRFFIKNRSCLRASDEP